MGDMERARELVARYDHTDVSELSGMNADTRRIAAIAAAGLALRNALTELFAYMPGAISPEMGRFAMMFADIRERYDAAIAQAVAEGGE